MEKTLVVSVDGSYTNESVLKKLDKNVTLIGRIRIPLPIASLSKKPVAYPEISLAGLLLPIIALSLGFNSNTTKLNLCSTEL